MLPVKHSESLEVRLAVLEQQMSHSEATQLELKTDAKDIKLHLGKQDKLMSKLIGGLIVIQVLMPFVLKALLK